MPVEFVNKRTEHYMWNQEWNGAQVLPQVRPLFGEQYEYWQNNESGFDLCEFIYNEILIFAEAFM